MREKKTYRIVVDGKVLGLRRTARELAGAVVAIGRDGPKILHWVKKRAAEKSSNKGEKFLDKRIRFLHYKFVDPVFVKAS